MLIKIKNNKSIEKWNLNLMQEWQELRHKNTEWNKYLTIVFIMFSFFLPIPSVVWFDDWLEVEAFFSSCPSDGFCAFIWTRWKILKKNISYDRSPLVNRFLSPSIWETNWLVELSIILPVFLFDHFSKYASTFFETGSNGFCSFRGEIKLVMLWKQFSLRFYI